MKWIGIARIYDKVSGHNKCRRRVYVRTEHGAKITNGKTIPLYILRCTRSESYHYVRIDMEKYDIEFV